MDTKAYHQAQQGLAQIKGALHVVLTSAPESGISNAEIGRALGIYGGHVGHEGHISRTLLAVMEAEGVALQDKDTKKWFLKTI